MHSVLVQGGDEKANLYRTSRKGEPVMLQASLAQIRQIADDLVTYFNFGLALANGIATEIWKADRQAGMLAFHGWPDKPSLPKPLASK
jgi:hypothetical protein